MQIDFAFGRSGLALDLPEGFSYQTLEARSAVPLSDPAAAIERALDNPQAGPPLRRLASGKGSAAISVCDITRPAPNREVLPPLLARLESAGVPRQRTTILIATGLHRPATEAEVEEICGEWAARKYRVVSHQARRLAQHLSLGIQLQEHPSSLTSASFPPTFISPWDSSSLTSCWAFPGDGS